MNINKIIIYITVIASVIMIAFPTLYKVIKDNHNKLYIVNHKYIIEAAENCYYNDDCKNNKITLKELYDKKYLEKGITDPVTKELYSEDSYVLLSKKDSSFFPA